MPERIRRNFPIMPAAKRRDRAVVPGSWIRQLQKRSCLTITTALVVNFSPCETGSSIHGPGSRHMGSSSFHKYPAFMSANTLLANRDVPRPSVSWSSRPLARHSFLSLRCSLSVVSSERLQPLEIFMEKCQSQLEARLNELGLEADNVIPVEIRPPALNTRAFSQGSLLASTNQLLLLAQCLACTLSSYLPCWYR
jgi:hypothetical protein